jgi:hypothetical protein
MMGVLSRLARQRTIHVTVWSWLRSGSRALNARLGMGRDPVRGGGRASGDYSRPTGRGRRRLAGSPEHGHGRRRRHGGPEAGPAWTPSRRAGTVGHRAPGRGRLPAGTYAALVRAGDPAGNGRHRAGPGDHQGRRPGRPAGAGAHRDDRCRSSPRVRRPAHHQGAGRGADGRLVHRGLHADGAAHASRAQERVPQVRPRNTWPRATARGFP